MKNKILQTRKFKQQGFSLLEVIIALVISNVALLGLVAGQLKSLQYANNSLQYTVSLIQANNVIEQVMNDICNLTTTPTNFTNTYSDALQSTLKSGYTLSWDDMTTPIGNFTTNFPVYISWVDKRMIDESGANELNKIAIMANFPTLPSGC